MATLIQSSITFEYTLKIDIKYYWFRCDHPYMYVHGIHDNPIHVFTSQVVTWTSSHCAWLVAYITFFLSNISPSILPDTQMSSCYSLSWRTLAYTEIMKALCREVYGLYTGRGGCPESDWLLRLVLQTLCRWYRSSAVAPWAHRQSLWNNWTPSPWSHTSYLLYVMIAIGYIHSL